MAAEPSCLRCGCDLALVRRAEEQARWLMTSAVQALARGDHHLAAACARAARVLEATPLAQAVLRSLPYHQEDS